MVEVVVGLVESWGFVGVFLLDDGVLDLVVFDEVYDEDVGVYSLCVEWEMWWIEEDVYEEGVGDLG